MRRSLLLLTVVFSMVLCLVPSGWAQENATITGTVTDSTGAVVSNVTITLTNQATGQVRTELSNSSGTYLFANMGVGQFTLAASATGFEKFSRTDISVNVAQSFEGRRHPYGG